MSERVTRKILSVTVTPTDSGTWRFNVRDEYASTSGSWCKTPEEALVGALQVIDRIRNPPDPSGPCGICGESLPQHASDCPGAQL